MLRRRAAKRIPPHIHPVEEESAGRNVVEAEDEVRQRALARAGGPDQGHRPPGPYLQEDVAQDGPSPLIPECDVLKGHLAPHPAGVDSQRRVGQIGPGGQDLPHVPCAGGGLL